MLPARTEERAGIDWAESHHDVAIIGDSGQLVAKKRIPHDPAGFAQLVDMLTAAGDCAEGPVPVAIETGEVRSRRRDDPGQHPARRRSPAPPPAGRQPTVQAIAVLARAHQDAIWARSKAHHQLRSLLREFFPTFLAIFTDRFTMGIASPEARAVLAIAPTPGAAAKLSVSRIGAALRRAGRSRGIDQTAAEINAGLRNPNCTNYSGRDCDGQHALALLAALDTACADVDDLGQASAELFQTHPDYAIITSFPGLGSAPITRASGRSISVTHRHVKNNRLANAS